MIKILDTDYLQLIIDTEQSYWSVYSKEIAGALLENVSMGITYRARRQRSPVSYPLQYLEAQVEKIIDPIHGHVQAVTLKTKPDKNGVVNTVFFSLPEDYPLLFWKLEIENGGNKPIYVDKIELLDVGPFLKKRILDALVRSSAAQQISGNSAIRLSSQPGDLAFFSNGWGSWNYSAVYGHEDYSQRSWLGPFTQPMRKNRGTPQLRGRGKFAGDMFGVLGDREHRTGILVGFLSQQQHFGSVQASTEPLNPALRLWSNGDDTRLDPEQSMQTDWACVQMLRLDLNGPMDPYVNAVARQHQIPDVHDAENVPVGWCSWYHFFQDITAQDVRANLATIQGIRGEFPIDLIQIDDGYQSQVGDWLEFSPNFPNGVAPLAAEIQNSGNIPGLWIAPFIVHPRSRLAREKRGWLLRNAWGVPVNAGFIWNKFTRALDLSHPDALDYVKEVVSTAVNEWGFPYLKLDFLYAAALPGRYRDPTKTRAQVLRGALEQIRQAAGSETTLLGCGCPLGSAIGIVDAMRIGADVAPNWNPKYGGISFLFKNEPDFPAVRNAVQNVVTRAFIHNKWWVNDPDCLLIRAESDLSLDEVRTLATVIALSGGTLLLSDHLPQVSPERMRLAKSLLPLIGQRPIVLDWFDKQTPARMRVDLKNTLGEWHLLAYMNWDDRAKEVGLHIEEYQLDPSRSYLGREFWSGAIYTSSDGLLGNILVPAHGSVVLAARQFEIDQPKYLGSDLHISQGFEVTHWKVGLTGLSIGLERPGQIEGFVDLYLPEDPKEIHIGHQSVSCGELYQRIYRLTVNASNKTNIDVAW